MFSYFFCMYGFILYTVFLILYRRVVIMNHAIFVYFLSKVHCTLQTVCRSQSFCVDFYDLFKNINLPILLTSITCNINIFNKPTVVINNH